MNQPVPNDSGSSPAAVLYAHPLPTRRETLQRTLLLAWRLFLRDTAAKYRYSILGLIWAVITPLFLVAMLLLLNRSGIVHVGVTPDLPYPVFAITGVAVWGIFSTGLSGSAESLSSAGATMSRINFPMASLVIAGAGTGLVEFLVRLPVVLAVWIWYGCGTAPLGYVLGIASILPILVLTVALGLIVAVGTVVVRDVVHVLPIALSLLMLLSPIMYLIPPESLLGRLNLLNPIAYFVNTTRSLFLGRYDVPGGYWLSTLGAVLLLLIGGRFFATARKKILERL